MKNSCRIFTGVLILSLFLSIFAGCEENEASTTGQDAETTDTGTVSQTDTITDEPEVTEEEIPFYPISNETIEFTGFAPSMDSIVNLAGGDLNNITNIAAANEVTNVYVDWAIVSMMAGTEQFSVMVASGDYADIMAAPIRWYPTGATGLLENEICMDIMPYLEEYAPDYYKFYQEHEVYAKFNTTDSGQLVQMSMYDLYTEGLIIRKDWLDDLGFDIPTTYDGLTEVLIAFANEKSVKNAVSLVKDGTFGVSTGVSWLTGGYGVPQNTSFNDLPWHVDEDGNVIMSYTDEGYYEYYKMISEWYAAGVFTDEILNFESKGTDYRDAILLDDIGFGVFDAATLNDSYAATYSGSGNFEIYPMADVTKTGTETLRLGELGSITQMYGFGVSAQCEQPEAAVMYLNWFWTEEGEFVSNYGVQGLCYEYDENGNIYFTDLLMSNPDGWSFSIAGQAYISYRLSGYNMLMEKFYMTYDNELCVDAFDIWTSNRTSDGIYYGSLTAEETVIYNEQLSDMVTYMSECIAGYIVGQKSLDTYWDAIDQLYSMGLQDMIDVKQAAYDRYQKR